MQFYLKSKPISFGVSVNDRLKYITYIIRKGIKYSNLKSVPWTSAEFHFDRGLQGPYTSTCTILQRMIFFLKSKEHQVSFEGRD